MELVGSWMEERDIEVVVGELFLVHWWEGVENLRD
jgi:hypothetical protein